ncbi:MAG: hypothetical protein KDA17_02795 [Candidatus Saccharibacteria bacterium]|nr:hypothetical protein [Candidatus Saccharibacteria bacterium]
MSEIAQQIVPPHIRDRIDEWPKRKALLERMRWNMGELARKRAELEEEKQDD